MLSRLGHMLGLAAAVVAALQDFAFLHTLAAMAYVMLPRQCLYALYVHEWC